MEGPRIRDPITALKTLNKSVRSGEDSFHKKKATDKRKTKPSLTPARCPKSESKHYSLPKEETFGSIYCSMKKPNDISPVRTIRPIASNEDGEFRVYNIKHVEFKEKNTPIITQNQNGPCPLIAIANVLLLREKIQLPEMIQYINANQLVEYIADAIMDNIPKDLQGEPLINYEQNMHDAIAFLPNLHKGLDVNVKFSGVREFEYTPECIIFDILGIPLYHGWVVDPQCEQTLRAIAGLSYNQLVERIMDSKSTGSDESVNTDALIAEDFLQSTASQLTYHGLYELGVSARDDELAVFFRNNHFSTVYKHCDQLFLLVTDHGFLHEPSVVWESLCNIEGDSQFVDGRFVTVPPKRSASQEELARREQIAQDEELARRMEAEERRAASKYEPASHGMERGGGGGGGPARRNVRSPMPDIDRKRDCSVM